MIMIWKPRAIFVPITHRNHSDDDLFIAQLDFWIQSSTLIDRIENHKPIFTKLRQKTRGFSDKTTCGPGTYNDGCRPGT